MDAVKATGVLPGQIEPVKLEELMGASTELDFSAVAIVCAVLGGILVFVLVAQACSTGTEAAAGTRLLIRLEACVGLNCCRRRFCLKRRVVPQASSPRRASQLALAIPADFEWLRPPARTRLRRADPNAETVGQWIDMLADASIDLIQDVQPGCALPVRVLDAAHAAQVVADGPGLSDDVSALQALQKALIATPALLPRTLLLAASYCDENVRAEALCLLGDAAAASYLGTLLSAGSELPGAVEAALHLIALAGPGGAVPGSNARAQLALLLRRREPYADAVAIARMLVSDCLDAMDDPEFLSEDVVIDGEAVALVRGLVAGYLLLGSRQAEAEGRIHTCVDASLHTWTRARATAPRCKPWIKAFAMGPWSKPWARNSPSGPW